MRWKALSGLLFALPLLGWVDNPEGGALARLDRAAVGFKDISSSIRLVSHTAAVNEDSVDTGTMLLKREKPGDIRMRIDITEPNQKTVAFHGRKLEIFFPKIQTVQEYDVRKNRSLREQFLLLGFGSTSAELESAYTIRVAGAETLAGQKAAKLELIPKSKDVAQHLKQVDLSLNDKGYPAQQKFYMPAGDYSLVTYTNLKVNTDIPESALKLNLPKGVRRESPQK
jgi:outer membrane lipoprotein-sorting protein